MVVPRLPHFPHSNLRPAPLTRFIGRARELIALEPLVFEARLLTLTGPGGIGKTRLALELANRVRGHFSERVWFVELAPLADAALVELTVARTLGIPDQPDRALWEVLVEALSPCQALLMLDNCEHLVDASARLAEQLLQACPSLHIVATSRQSLGISGEYAWRVPSLDLPHVSAPPEVAIQAEAVQLFLDRARMAQPGFALNTENARGVVRISRQLDGIPLAIELAAARLNLLSVEQLADRLERHLRVLGGGNRTALPRQRTLEATLEWSFLLLTPPEQTLFRELAPFAGGFTLEAAEAVCAGQGLLAEDMLDLLASLVDKSLVVVEQHEAHACYRLLEPLRQYAIQKLRMSGEEGCLRIRHRDWYVRVVQRVASVWQVQQDSVCLDRLEHDLDNMRAALDWCVASDDAQPGLELLDALWFYWNVRGQLGEWRARFEGLLGLPSASHPSAGRARGLNAAGYLALAQGDELRARQFHVEALAIARHVDDPVDAAMALRRLGILDRLIGEMAPATAQLEESLRLARQVGDETATYLTLYTLADTLSVIGAYDRAIERYEQSLELTRGAGDQWHTGMVLLGLGYAAARMGDRGRSRAALSESLRILHSLGDRRIIAGCLEGFACLASLAGEPARAAHLFGFASGLRKVIGAAAEPFFQADNERAVAIARAHLSDEVFDTAASHGQEQTLETVIAFALAQDQALPDTAPRPEPPPFGLTAREHEIAKLLARGLTNRAIAAELIISQHTAETHVKRILAKLGLSSRTQLAARAAELGLNVVVGSHGRVPT